MPPVKNETVCITVESVANDGNGVGRCDGMAIFVPGAAVGDRLAVLLVKVNKSHAYGKIQQLLSPGPGRQTPDCPISGRCGGCAFRHLTYEAELQIKRGFIADALQRIGGLEFPVPEVLPSPETCRYRNKVQYPVAQQADGRLIYGFFAARSHRVVPCENCMLQPQTLNNIASCAIALLQSMGATAYDETTCRGLLRHIMLRQSNKTGQVLLCLVLTQRSFSGAQSFARAMSDAFPIISGVVLNFNPAKTSVILGDAKADTVIFGLPYITDELCGVPLTIGVHTFAQINSAAARHLFEIAAGFAAPKKTDIILDLYCGGGVIGLSMARLCKHLIGVEITPQAVKSAQNSATEMGLGNTRFICAGAEEEVARLAGEGLRPNIVTVDPPRKGIDAAAMRAILVMQPERIVMISCNPATMARDVRALAEGGYILRKIQPADLFPRTKHIECVALLEKNGVKI